MHSKILLVLLIGAMSWAQPVSQEEMRAYDVSVAFLESRVAELRARYGENHPEVVAARRKLQTARFAAEVAKSPDRWWRNADIAKRVGLEQGQQLHMDGIYLQYRAQLVDLNAALEKAEVALEPMMSTQTLDEQKLSAQIDRIANARADLEKAKSRMLLAIRMQMTLAQWNRLNHGSLPRQ